MMSLTFRTAVREGYLLMTYKGRYVPSMAARFAGQILAACEKRHASKILVDIREVTGRLSPLDRLDLGTTAGEKHRALKSSKKIPGCRFAVVGKYPLIDPKRLAGTVAHGLGMDVKVSTDMSEALVWLGVDAASF
jgi:hypothetical protein